MLGEKSIEPLGMVHVELKKARIRQTISEKAHRDYSLTVTSVKTSQQFAATG
jgi:hypothetical protein